MPPEYEKVRVLSLYGTGWQLDEKLPLGLIHSGLESFKVTGRRPALNFTCKIER